MTLPELLERWVAPLKRRVMLMISRALVTAVSDKAGIQLVQVNLGHDEIISSVERVQNFGFSSHPNNDTEALVLFLAGNRDHPLVIAVDDSKSRLPVNKGDSVQYNSSGARVHCKGATIEINTGGILLPIDGVVTGQTIDSFTGVPIGTNLTNISSKVKAEF